ncbi:hypothetical protein [Lolliginicoccus levis]|uniref:hypothetical protein n=1 Tax=Lolliginicoccus levis TaxID=2919542 RepID=UPI00241D6A1D|nr:hypothetical protein [Lolliginicoccus levis]
MYMQVFQGHVADEQRLRDCLDQWTRDIRPGATGYLGATCGSSDDGTFVAMVRFDSEESARRNSERPEQGKWWSEAEKCFDGEVTFMDCPDVTEWLGGPSGKAGFVQVMEGHSPDIDRMRAIQAEESQRMHELRPEVIGGTLARYGDDGYIEAVYFTSEAEAREHERLQMPASWQAAMDEERRLMGDVRYLDLHRPLAMS